MALNLHKQRPSALRTKPLTCLCKISFDGLRPYPSKHRIIYKLTRVPLEASHRDLSTLCLVTEGMSMQRPASRSTLNAGEHAADG